MHLRFRKESSVTSHVPEVNVPKDNDNNNTWLITLARLAFCQGANDVYSKYFIR